MIEPYWQSGHDSITVDVEARSPELFEVDETDPKNWRVTQKLKDPIGDLDWSIEGEVDVVASEEQGTAVLRLIGITKEGGIPKDGDESISKTETETKPDFSDVPDEDDLWAAYEEEEEEK